MTNDTNTRTKVNAVCVAAIMVVSMVAVGFAAAPAAAVTDTGSDGISTNVTTVGEDATHSFNVTVESGDNINTATISRINVDYGANFAGADDVFSGVDSSDVTVLVDGSPVDWIDDVTDNTGNADINVTSGTALEAGSTIEVQIDGLSNPTGAETDDVMITLDDGTDADEIGLELETTSPELEVSPGSAAVTPDQSDSADLTVTATDSNDDPIDVPVEANAPSTSGTVNIDGSGTTTSSATGSDGEVTFAVTTDTAQSFDVEFTEQVTTAVDDRTTVSATVDAARQVSYEVDGEALNLVFRGQEVSVTNLEPGETYQLRTVNDYESGGDDVTSSSFEDEFSADDDGAITIDTGEYEAGDYFLRGEDIEEVRGTTFEVAVQSWEGEFDPTEVDNGGENSETTYTVETNRGGDFSVLVSAKGPDGDAVANDTLVGIIGGASDTVDDSETVRVTGVSNGEDITADFDGQDAGNYSIVTGVEDSTAEANETIAVNDIGEGAVSLAESYVTVPQGDNAELTLEFEGGQDAAYVRVGDESEVNYEANITVDSNGEDNVTLLFNTYATGSDRGDFVTVEDEDSDAKIVDTDTNQMPDDLDLLATGTYPIEISGDGLDAIANDEATDVGDLEIRERSVGEFNVWTTSDNALDEVEDAEDVASAAEDGTLQQRNEVVNGDVVVHEIQATGLEGLVDTGVQTDSDALFSDEDGFLGTLSESDSKGMDLRIRQTADTTTLNSPRKQADLDAMADDISVIEGDGVYYLAFDSDDIELENDRNVETGDAYEVRLRIKDERLLDPNEDELDDGEISDFYQTSTTTFSVEEAEGSFDEPVEVEAGEEQVISGTTNVAPGNTLSIRARSDDDVTPGFVVSQSEVEVSSDGTFTADELDFSDASVGDNFTVATRNSPFDEEVESDGTVVEQVDDGEDGEDGTDDGADGTDDGEDGTDDGEDGTDDGEDGTDDGEDGNDTDGSDGGGSGDDTPGFGALVALVALIAAALLATRRRE